MLTPYCTGLLVASLRPANRLVTRYLPASTVLGWAALGSLFAGVFAVGGHDGMLMAFASAPLVGLAVWKLRPGDDDGPGFEPDDMPPAPDAVARGGRRLPSPPRKRPTGHPTAPRRPGVPAR